MLRSRRRLIVAGLVVATGSTTLAVGLGTAATTGPPSQATSDPLLAQNGMSRADSTRSAVTRAGTQLFINRANAVSCLTTSNGSGHCVPDTAIAAGGGLGISMCLTDLPTHQLRVTGIVPRGVKFVQLDAGTVKAAAPAVEGGVAFEVSRAKLISGTSIRIAWAASPDAPAGSASVPVDDTLVDAACTPD